MPWTSGCLVSYPQLSNFRSSYISYHYLGQKASKCVSHEQLQIPSAVFVPAMPYLFDCPLKNILERLQQTIFWSMMTKCQNASKFAPHESSHPHSLFRPCYSIVRLKQFKMLATGDPLDRWWLRFKNYIAGFDITVTTASFYRNWILFWKLYGNVPAFL